MKPNNPSNALNVTGSYDEKRMVSSTPNPIRLQTHSRVAVKVAKAASPSGVSRIFVRGVLSFGLLYDCACVNPKCYPCDFRTRRGRRVALSGVWRHALREYISLQGNFLRQFSRTCPDRLRVALQVTVGDWEAFFNRNSN